MPNARGVDYAWTHPDPAALAASGYTFACRYLSRDPAKNLTLNEAQALAAHGIWCVCNWEYGAQDMLRGYAGGVADAQLAHAQALAAGMPESRPIYFSADWDVTPAQEPTLLAYLSGAAAVIGAQLTGEYGGYYPVKIARDHGTVWTWQTDAWSGGQWDARDTVRQIGSATVGGVQVDINEAMAADFGQWMPGRLPEVAPPMQHLTSAIYRHRENDMHVDLQPNKPVVFTNPGAVTMQSATLLLAGDFGDAVVRVALFDIKTGWGVATYPVGRVAGAVKIPLPPQTNKVSLLLESGPGIVGADVLA